MAGIPKARKQHFLEDDPEELSDLEGRRLEVEALLNH